MSNIRSALLAPNVANQPRRFLSSDEFTHPNDDTVQDRKLILREPKSGNKHEIVFIPQEVADRLRDYAAKKCKSPQDWIFPISHEAIRWIENLYG
ncbi:MAG: hypothetical protein R6V60_10830 [Desulfobacterales bacterium]